MRIIKEPSEEAIEIHSRATVIDIHCHPSIKVKLFNYKIYDIDHHFVFKVDPSPTDEIFQMQYDLWQMDNGGVDGIWSSIYVVEREFADKSSLKAGVWLSKFIGLGFDELIERNTPAGPFVQAIELMHKMESQVIEAEKKGWGTIFAKNYTEFEDGLNKGKKCLVHALEGAHMLGRHYDNLQTYLDRLQSFSSEGVCSITLSHFAPNNICFPVNGISPKTKKGLGFNIDYTPFIKKGLTEVGKLVVDLMFDLGIIVDLNHITPTGRQDIFKINDDRKSRGLERRPIVFSHSGIRDNCPNEMLTPTKEEIKKIQECRGVIGVIFMNYWLVGKEGMPDDGIINIVKTIKDIAKICGGSYENIAIGSDMDGFTQPVDDLYTSKHMPRLTQALLDEKITSEDIKKILGGNTLRVMKEGWGKN